jgi:lipid-binding SYLF domain-containing protein
MRSIWNTALAAALTASSLLTGPAFAKTSVVVHRRPVACPLASASGKTAKLVETATRTVQDFRGSSAARYLSRAKAIIIVPSLVKVGLVIGGQSGDAVLVRHNRTGWSYPAFYSMGSASFGIQAGIDSAQVVLLIMTDRALRSVEQDRFKLGSEAGLAIFMVGGNAGNPSYHDDIIGWARAGGLYAGLTVNDSTLEQKPRWNAEYYDHEYPVNDVFAGKVCNADADKLRRALR